MENSTHSTQIDALFQRYMDAWNAQDFAGYAACLTEPATMILPAGMVVLDDQAAMIAMLEGFHARLVEAGFDHSTMGAHQVQICNNDLAVADLRSLRRHRADGSVMEEVDMHYVLRRDTAGWKFAVAVACAPAWQQAATG